MTILIAHDGGIRMFADSDWGLDSLAAHYGAKAAYRVTASRRSIGVASLSPATPAQAARLFFPGSSRSAPL
jgi:hypothetical protein